MSRIGKVAVEIPKEVKIKIESGMFQCEGPKGKSSVKIPQLIELEVNDNRISVKRKNDTKNDRAFHGLIRNLVKNALIGVSQGYSRKLDIHGVGYKAQMKGKKIMFQFVKC